jgi:hypothetical protein
MIPSMAVAGGLLFLVSFGLGYWYRNERAKEDRAQEYGKQWHDEYWGTFWKNRSDLWYQPPGFMAPGTWSEKEAREQMNLNSKKARKMLELRKVTVHIDGRKWRKS